MVYSMFAIDTLNMWVSVSFSPLSSLFIWRECWLLSVKLIDDKNSTKWNIYMELFVKKTLNWTFVPNAFGVRNDDDSIR